MKTYTFPYYISFGPGDNVEDEITISLSEKDSRRIVSSAEKENRRHLYEDEDIRDIFDTVQKSIVDSLVAKTLNDPLEQEAFGFDSKSDLSETDIKTFLDGLNIGINYPEKLQSLKTKNIGKVVQSEAEIVIIDRAVVDAYIKDAEHQNQIVYTDRGETLIYVSRRYSGKLNIKAGVKTIERGVLSGRTKITEVIIQEGLEEVGDSAFEGCTSLIKVDIPGSVRKVGFNAFSKCEKLKTIILHEGIKEIDSTAFRFCSNLNELYIPSTVELFNAFTCSYWNGIKKIHFAGVNTKIDDSRGGNLKGQVLYVKEGSLAEEYAKRHMIEYICE